MIKIQQINRSSIHRFHHSPKVKVKQCVRPYARKHTNDYKEGVDSNIIGFGVSICSALVVLSACTVTALTLREANIEKQSFIEDYVELEKKVMVLEDKDVQYEIVINALVNELMKLRDIGIV